MSVAYVLNTNVTRNGAQIASTSTTTTQENVFEFSGTVAIGTDTAILVTVTYAQVKLVYIYSSAACTIETESGSAAEQTFTFAAGGYIIWDSNSAQACPFTTDFTDLYVTNAAATDLTIVIVHNQP